MLVYEASIQTLIPHQQGFGRGHIANMKYEIFILAMR